VSRSRQGTPSLPRASQVVVVFDGVETGSVEVVVKAAKPSDPAFISGRTSAVLFWGKMAKYKREEGRKVGGPECVCAPCTSCAAGGGAG